MTEAQVLASVLTLTGVAFGFGLNLISQWVDRQRRARGHYISLGAEVEECADQAATYIEDNIPAPLYRLPMDAFQRAREVLVVDGTISAPELRAIRRYYATVDEFNRGLEYITDIRREGADNEQIRNELRRNVMKARRLTRDGEYYKPANAALVRRSV